MANNSYNNTSKVIIDILDDLEKEINKESRIIETLPDDLDMLLWCRRGLYLAQQIILNRASVDKKK